MVYDGSGALGFGLLVLRGLICDDFVWFELMVKCGYGNVAVLLWLGCMFVVVFGFGFSVAGESLVFFKSFWSWDAPVPIGFRFLLWVQWLVMICNRSKHLKTFSNISASFSGFEPTT